MTERRMLISGHEIDISFLEENELVERALSLMREAHEGEFRKIRGEPFVTHPIDVARIAGDYYEGEVRAWVQALSLVHDVIDSPVARERISPSLVRERVGIDLALGVYSLSKSQKISDDRLRRLDYIKMRQVEDSPKVQVVACGDKIDNIEKAIEELQLVGDAFWRKFKGGKAVYLAWPREVLGAIVDSGALDGHPVVDRYDKALSRFDSAAGIERTPSSNEGEATVS